MPAHRAQAVKVIRRGGEHLLSLIDASLDLARIEAGRFRLEPGPWALAEGMDDLVRMLRPQAETKGLAFEYEPGELPAWVRADSKRMQQVLINLLGNALKYTVSGRVRFEVRYTREMARFVIEDSGPGMSEAELARVFEPFERGSGVGQPGTGLGLTIAKMLTELMGGEMQVTSKDGEGTRFTLRFFLPRTEPRRPEAKPEPTPEARSETAPMQTVMPSREQLLALESALALGHVRGIHQQLDRMAEEAPAYVEELRALVREFQLKALGNKVAHALQSVPLDEHDGNPL